MRRALVRRGTGAGGTGFGTGLHGLGEAFHLPLQSGELIGEFHHRPILPFDMFFEEGNFDFEFVYPGVGHARGQNENRGWRKS